MPPDDPPTTQTIEEIQGTGATSPFVGKAVTTEGVVTAAYPTGGFNGFYLQTAGTGGDVDAATHQRIPTRSSCSAPQCRRPRTSATTSR